VKIGAFGGVLAGVALCDDQDRLAFAKGLDELDRALAADRKRQNGMGKEHRIADGQHRQGALIRLGRTRLGGCGCASGADDAYKII
jgi:hypothetical protein